MWWSYGNSKSQQEIIAIYLSISQMMSAVLIE